MAWLQLSLDLEGLDLAAVQKDCEELGAVSVSLVDTDANTNDNPVLEPLPGEMPLWQRTRLVALFKSTDAGLRTRDALRRQLADRLRPATPEISAEELPERDWVNVWRNDTQPSCFGERLWVCRDGQRPQDPDALTIDLDPGLAFGTGAHPSTALCLEWLARAPLAGTTVIDYGCGSGILAVAAARLGAASVIATDIDEQALIATRENAEKNDLGNIVQVKRPDQLQPGETDILVANILSNPLRQLVSRFAELVRAEGRIALAGILQEQVNSVQNDYEKLFVMAQSGREGDWALLAGRRRVQSVSRDG